MDRGRRPRVAAVAALLIVAALTLRPTGPVSGAASRTGMDTVTLSLAALCGAAAAACLLVALHRLATLRGTPRAGRPARRRPSVVRQVVTLAMCAALLLSPLGSLLLQRLGDQVPPPAGPTASEQAKPRPSTQPARRPAALTQAAAIGAGLMVLGLLAAALLRRRWPAVPGDSAEVPELAVAISAGLAELDLADGGDPRDRVIRCYAAMERVLAATGTQRRPADTPGELLARAEAGGRVPAAEVATLTELFRRARFGRTPVTSPEVETARDCLLSLHAAAGRDVVSNQRGR